MVLIQGQPGPGQSCDSGLNKGQDSEPSFRSALPFFLPQPPSASAVLGVGVCGFQGAWDEGSQLLKALLP